MTLTQTSSSLLRTTRSRRTATLMVAVVFGLLLWAKLLLVTNHPRTAIADPEPASPASQLPAPGPR